MHIDSVRCRTAKRKSVGHQTRSHAEARGWKSEALRVETEGRPMRDWGLV
jgi:hypothetical protein